jgi:hypothetical protein
MALTTAWVLPRRGKTPVPRATSFINRLLVLVPGWPEVEGKETFAPRRVSSKHPTVRRSMAIEE